MSIGSFGDVRLGGIDRDPFAPSFLMRGPVYRYGRKVESVQFDRVRRPIVGAGALLLGAGVAGVIFIAALGACLMLDDSQPKLSANATPADLPAARVQKETTVPVPASVRAENNEGRTKTPSQTSAIGSAAQGNPEAPRLVRTERFDGDPGVWRNVRKFSPLPAEEVPVLEGAPTAQSLVAAPAVPDSPRRVGMRRDERARAQPRGHHRGRSHTVVRRVEDDAPSDVGGTQMNAAELRRDGSKNPLVSAFSSIVGPK